MKYLRSFNESIGGDDLYRQLSDDESKYYLDRSSEVINRREFLRLKDIQFNYYRDDNHVIVYDEGNSEYTFDYSVNHLLDSPLTVIKIDDDWWIIISEEDSIWLCDTIDGVELWFKEMVS